MPGGVLLLALAFALLLGFSRSGINYEFLSTLILIGLPIITAIGCGTFASFIQITQEYGREEATKGRITRQTIKFVLLQILAAPLVCGVMGYIVFLSLSF